MSDRQEQVKQLQQKIDSGVNETTSYLGQVKKNVQEFDAQNQFTQTAQSYLEVGIDKATASVEQLKDAGSNLRAHANDASDETMEAARKSLEQVKHALDTLRNQAQDYDKKFVTGDREGVLATVQHSVENVINTTRQRSMDAIEMAKDQWTRLWEMLQGASSTAQHGVKVAVGETARVAGKVDNTLGVSSTAGAAVGAVAGVARNADERLGVSVGAASVDQRLTGGMGGNLANKGMGIVNDTVGYISESLQNAKIAAEGSEAAQHVEGRAQELSGAAKERINQTGVPDSIYAGQQRASETFEAAKQRVASGKSTENDESLYSQAAGMIQNAKTSAMGYAGVTEGESTSQQAQQAAGTLRNRAADGANTASDKAHEGAASLKHQTYSATEDVRHQLHNAADYTSDRTHEAADVTRSKGQEMADKSHHQSSTAADKAHEYGEHARGYARDTADSGANKAHHATSRAQSAVHEQTEPSKPGFGEKVKGAAHHVKEKLHDTMSRHKDTSN